MRTATGFAAYVRRIWAEIEPIISHGIVAAFFLLVVSGLSEFARRLPLSDRTREYVDTFDNLFVPTLLYLFGSYTIIRLVIRFIQGIIETWKSSHRPENGHDTELRG